MDCRNKYYTSYLIILVTSLTMPLMAHAQVTTYSLQECIAIALQNNIDYQNSILDQQNAKNAYNNSYGQKIPTLSINGNQAINAGYTVDPFTNQFITQTIRSNNFSANSSVSLYSGNQINNTHKRLRSAWEAAKYSQDVTKNQIILETAQYYVGLLSAIKIEEAAKSRLSRSINDKLKIQRKIETQTGSKSELSDADAQIATEELSVSQARGNITKQKLLLAQRMVVQDVNFSIVVPNINNLLTEVPDTNINSVFEQALDNLPEVKVSKQNNETNKRVESIARGVYYPTITLSGSITTGYSSARTRLRTSQGSGGNAQTIYIQDTATGRAFPISTSLFQNSGVSSVSEKYPFRDQLQDNINRSINIQGNIPILNRLTTRNSVENAVIARKKSENEMKRTYQSVFNNIALAITEYKISSANLKAYDRQVKSLLVALKTAETRVELGSGSIFDLLSPQMLLAAAQSNLIQQQYDLVFRRLVIDFYTGKPITL